MEIIKSVQIRKFRSLKSVTKGLELTDLNIFVGQNDQGKSNVLRALNLFFNNETDLGARYRFSDDYCYHSNTGKGTRQEIRVDLIIEPPKSRFKNAKTLQWTKKWKKDGSIIEERKYLENGKQLSPKDNVYKWLNKIRYRYIPAIKGQNYFSSLMGELHDVLNEAHSEVLNSQGEDFISGIQEVTQNITKELDEQIGISNTIQVPSDFKQLFSNLDFGVRVEENTYHLKQRGDGIKIRHIPVILKYMSEQEKNISRAGYVKPDTIWGFEEPENNLELKYAFDLAESFKSYSKDIQILVTTHSPAFYALDKIDGDGVNTFYISQGDDSCTRIQKVSHDDTDELHQNMGLLPIITPYLAEIYDQEQKIITLEKELEGLRDEVDHVVLTEDEKHELIESFCQIHGCDTAKTEIISYHGANQISSALIIAKYLKQKRPELSIVIHRDRDYLEDEAVRKMKTKIEKAGFTFFVTKGVDLENEFICPLHINSLYPEISVERAKELIDQSSLLARDDSVSRLVDHTFKTEKPQNNGFYKKSKELESLFDEDTARYRYGKKVMGHLKGKIQAEIGENADLLRHSNFIVNQQIEDFFW